MTKAGKPALLVGKPVVPVPESNPQLNVSESRSSHRRVGLMLALVGILHLPSLFNPFFIDDYIYLDTVHDLTWSGIPEIFTTATMDEDASGVWWTPKGLLPFYRPLAILTFAVDYQIWGMNPFGYHLVNLLWHLLCTYLTWRLAGRLSRNARLAFAAATIFALNPIHTEAVVWISGRFDLMVCASALGSVLAYVNWRDRDGASHWWGVLSIVCFVIGLGCKETALILPAVYVAFELLRPRSTDARRITPAFIVAVVVVTVITLLYLAGRFCLFGGLGTLPPPYGVDLSSPTAVGILLWNVSQYLLGFALFIQIDAIYLSAFWAGHPRLFGALVGLSLMVLVACWYVAKRSRLFWIGVTWVVLFTAPALMAMPGERNVYLASVGIALIGTSVFAGLIERFQANFVHAGRLSRLAAGVVAVFSVMTVVELMVMGRVGGVANQVYEDLLAALPDPPPDTRIFIINQCPLNAVGFTQGVKLLYGRDDVVACALTLAPQLEGLSWDTVYRTGPSSIRIVRQDGVFFQSFIERFLLFNQPPSALPESAKRMNLRLVTVPESFDAVTELELALPRNLDAGRDFFFTWDNRHVLTPTDFFRRAKWPRLKSDELLVKSEE